MTKTHKAVLKSSFVMLVLFAVAGSGVAQAQECIARATSVMARAEGITEAVGAVELACQEPSGLGFGSPEVLEITVELNTAITNVIDNDRVVVAVVGGGLTYTEIAGTVLVSNVETAIVAAAFSEPAGVDAAEATLSEDGTAITWKIYSATLDLGPTGDDGFQVTIGGIKANASMIGDGEDVTAVVSVQGAAVHSGSLKVADVTTGLLVEVDEANVLQCDTDVEGETATLMIQEGYVNSITDANALMVSFTGIPEGVTVIVPGEVAAVVDTVDIGLTLQTDPRVSGVTVDDDGRNIVDLSASGSGAVVYDVSATAADLADEAVELMVTFEWEAGDVVDSGEVAVSFHPVSTMGGDTYEVNGAPPERYVASGSYTVIEVNPCLTTLLFPFVTNQNTFDTGLVITNASGESGSCTIDYSGANAPDDLTSQPVAGGAQWVALASVLARGFQGYITATCAFRDAHGFAFLTDGYGGTPTLAQSYLAVCVSDVCPGQ